VGCDAEENGGGVLPARGVADPDVVLKERTAEFLNPQVSGVSDDQHVAFHGRPPVLRAPRRRREMMEGRRPQTAKSRAMAIIASEDKTVSMIVDELLPTARPCSGTLPR